MEVPSNVPGHGIRTGMGMLLISKPHGKFPKLQRCEECREKKNV